MARLSQEDSSYELSRVNEVARSDTGGPSHLTPTSPTRIPRRSNGAMPASEKQTLYRGASSIPTPPLSPMSSLNVERVLDRMKDYAQDPTSARQMPQSVSKPKPLTAETLRDSHNLEKKARGNMDAGQKARRVNSKSSVKGGVRVAGKTKSRKEPGKRTKVKIKVPPKGTPRVIQAAPAGETKQHTAGSMAFAMRARGVRDDYESWALGEVPREALHQQGPRFGRMTSLECELDQSVLAGVGALDKEWDTPRDKYDEQWLVDPDGSSSGPGLSDEFPMSDPRMSMAEFGMDDGHSDGVSEAHYRPGHMRSESWTGCESYLPQEMFDNSKQGTELRLAMVQTSEMHSSSVGSPGSSASHQSRYVQATPASVKTSSGKKKGDAVATCFSSPSTSECMSPGMARVPSHPNDLGICSPKSACSGKSMKYVQYPTSQKDRGLEYSHMETYWGKSGALAHQQTGYHSQPAMGGSSMGCSEIVPDPAQYDLENNMTGKYDTGEEGGESAEADGVNGNDIVYKPATEPRNPGRGGRRVSFTRRVLGFTVGVTTSALMIVSGVMVAKMVWGLGQDQDSDHNSDNCEVCEEKVPQSLRRSGDDSEEVDKRESDAQR